MARAIEAIYKNGMLKLLEELDLAEHQHVKITIHESLDEGPDEALEAWTTENVNHFRRIPTLTIESWRT